MFWTDRAVRRFSRHMAMLLEADVPLHVAVELAGHQQRGRRWSRTIRAVTRDLADNGEALSKSLSRQRWAFREGYVQTIAWAEARGGLADMILAFRLLADDTTPRPAADPLRSKAAAEVDLDRFGRAVKG